MYPDFCQPFEKKRCKSANHAGNDFYLTVRECDGIPDCNDATDEMNCDDMPEKVYVQGKTMHMLVIGRNYEMTQYWLIQALSPKKLIQRVFL